MLMRNSEHRKELVSEIRSLAQSQGLNTVFTNSSLTAVCRCRQLKMSFVFSTWNIRTDTEVAL